MKLPYTISRATKEIYDASEVTRNALSEANRHVFAEDFEWDADIPPPLIYLAAKRLAEIFDRAQYLDKILLKDIDLMVSLFPTDLPLDLTVNLLTDDVYWQRCCDTKWPNKFASLGTSSSWKQKYLSYCLQDFLENANANLYDEIEAGKLAKLASPYITLLKITQLQMVRKPPLPNCSDGVIRDECIIPDEDIPVDHIPLESVVKELILLEEIDIVFGVKNMGGLYEERLFKFSLADCHSLCAGMADLPYLRILRIHRSLLDDVKVKVVMQFVAAKNTIEEIDFSYCKVGDRGAAAIAAVFRIHPNLRNVKLQNNIFNDLGIQALAYGIQTAELGDAPLEKIDLRMNTLSEMSANYLSSALVRCKLKPQELNLSGCALRGKAANSIAGLLQLNRGLRRLDLSGNMFGGEAETTLIKSLEMNRRILEINLRNTGISKETQDEVKRLLERNVQMLEEESIPTSEEIPPLYLNEPEYLIWEYNPDNPDYEPGHYPERVPEK